jgi:hypothetical protein
MFGRTHGASPSGKAPDFGSGIRRFESCRPSHYHKGFILLHFPGDVVDFYDTILRQFGLPLVGQPRLERMLLDLAEHVIGHELALNLGTLRLTWPAGAENLTGAAESEEMANSRQTRSLRGVQPLISRRYLAIGSSGIGGRVEAHDLRDELACWTQLRIVREIFALQDLVYPSRTLAANTSDKSLQLSDFDHK